MLPVIDFDDERCFQAYKADDVGTNWPLTAETVAVQLFTVQMRPKFLLCFGRIFTKVSGCL